MLGAALGHPAPTGAPNQLPSPAGTTGGAGGAALGSEESDCKEPTEQQSPSLAAD